MEKKKFKEKIRDYFNDKGEMRALAIATISGLLSGIIFLSYNMGKNNPNTMEFILRVPEK